MPVNSTGPVAWPVGEPPSGSRLTANNVSFNAAGTGDPDAGDVLTYEWDFTDDGTWDATGTTATHTYTAVGHPWVNHENVSTKSWHVKLVPNATKDLSEQLSETDPADVPASRVIGRPELIPLGEGLIPKGAIAYAGTFVVGKAIQRFHNGSSLSHEEREMVYREALDHGRTVAQSFDTRP